MKSLKNIFCPRSPWPYSRGWHLLFSSTPSPSKPGKDLIITLPVAQYSLLEALISCVALSRLCILNAFAPIVEEYWTYILKKRCLGVNLKEKVCRWWRWYVCSPGLYLVSRGRPDIENAQQVSTEWMNRWVNEWINNKTGGELGWR